MIDFKLKYSIQELKIPDKEIQFTFKIIHDINIRIFKPDKEYLEKAQKKEVVFAEASISISVKDKNLEIFENILQGNIAEFDTPYSQLTNHFGKEIIIPSLEYFPDHFRSFVSQINNELADAITKTISTLRWYLDKQGPHSPYSSNVLKCSIDGENWYPVPNSSRVYMETRNYDLTLKENDEKIILNLLQKNETEPIHHSLFREAWDHKTRNPRSSIIMAISSVEVAIKQLIEKVVPDATWLVSRLQSPPIFLIFSEYLPNLNIDNKVKGIKVLPSNEMNKKLKKCVSLRNEITHLGKKSIVGNELNEMLLTIKDVLHIIDFNSGYKWSIVHIRKSTLDEIGISN